MIVVASQFAIIKSPQRSLTIHGGGDANSARSGMVSEIEFGSGSEFIGEHENGTKSSNFEI